MRMLAPLLVALMACGPSVSGDDDGGNGPDADPNQPDSRSNPEFVDAAPPEPCEKMDILFVIDDSGSMAEEQDNLATNFPAFIDVIHNYVITTGEHLDYHVAATTTGRDVTSMIAIPGFPPFGPFTEQGANGELLMGDGCGMPRRWLERSDGTINEIADTFGCVARVGTGGPSLEMPLYTTELAFTEPMASTNTGFLRDDALLALVILTDENDCSRTDNDFEIENDQCNPPGPEVVDLSHYLQFLDTLKDVRGRWAVVVIAGPDPVPGGCEAYTATRLIDFVDQTGENAIFRSICTDDLSGALTDALDTFDAACDSFPPIP